MLIDSEDRESNQIAADDLAEIVDQKEADHAPKKKRKAKDHYWTSDESSFVEPESDESQKKRKSKRLSR